MSRIGTRMYNDNRFKLGLFGMNCSGGLTMTLAPEYWEASWENNFGCLKGSCQNKFRFLEPGHLSQRLPRRTEHAIRNRYHGAEGRASSPQRARGHLPHARPGRFPRYRGRQAGGKVPR